MSNTRLAFLGPPQFTRHDQTVDLTIGKLQALLAYLAVTGEPQSRTRLLDLLWRESHPDAARKTLRNTLWRMRQQLGDDVVLAHDDRLFLSDSVWTDLSAFESGMATLLSSTSGSRLKDELGSVTDGEIRALLDLWRGPLLDGLSLSDAPDFELWLQGERDRLGQLYLRGLDFLVGQHAAALRWQEVTDLAQRALVYDITRESMHVAAMEAYARLGQRTTALRQYDTLRQSLARELEMVPLAETETLRTLILTGELGPQEPQTILVRPAKRPHPPQSVTARAHPNRPFVGRQAECRDLDEALQAATEERLQIVLLSGELGMGKTMVWQHWSATLPASAEMLEMRCLESTQAMPLAPLTGLFGTQHNLARVAGPESPLSPVWLTELRRLLPHIGDDRPELPSPADLPPAEERHRLFEAFVQILRVLAERPIVLFIDDLHWADQATLDWLVYLSDRMSDVSLLLVCAYRASQASPALQQVVAAWVRDPTVRRRTLTPLTADESTALIAALKGNGGMADYLHSQSGGNPYYLTELNQVHPDGNPGALADLISARLRSLPESAQRLLQAAAILEPAIRFDMLHQISRQDEDETLDALDLLLSTDVLSERGDTYEFAHPLMAGMVRNELSMARRQRLHQRAAEQLETVHQDELETVAGSLLRHFAEGGQPEAAARYADMAAAQAFQIGAMTEAANYCRRAYALAPTPSRQLELGNVLMYIPGGLHESRQAMQQALAAAERGQDQDGIVQAGLQLAFSYLSTQQGEEVLHWAKRILASAEASDSVELHATVHYLMGAGKFYAEGTLAEADGHYREATRLATDYDLASDIAIQSWFGWGNLSIQGGDFDGAQMKFERTLITSQAAQNIYFEALSYNNLAYATLLADDVINARSIIERGLVFVEEQQLMRPRQYLYSTRGEVALAEGDLDVAESWFARSMDEALIYDNEIHALNVRAHLGRVEQARGRLDQASKFLTDAYRAIPEKNALHLQIQIALWLAGLYLECNDLRAAETHLTAARRHLAGSQRAALQATADNIERELALRRARQPSVGT